jgi:ParB family chromosome partitioning protein
MAKQKPTLALGETLTIPLNQLKLSDDNVRTIYAKDAIADLAADILTNGLIQGLSVRELGEHEGDVTHEVQGGGRRFRALQLLVKQKALAADAAIPCVRNESAIATQISLAENVTREALHPLDEYRAFTEMTAQGKSEDDIANAFRIPVKTVQQRLRLGKASPVLHKAFKEEKINLHTLMAFCVTDNQERQEQIWKRVKDQSYLNVYSLKQMLMEETVPANDKRALFIGLDAYVKAGGNINQDLFDAAHEGYLTDVDLLNQLAQAKLDREAEKLKAQGWDFAITGFTVPYGDTADYEQIPADNEELSEEQEQQLQALEDERDDLQNIDGDKLTKKQAKRLESIEKEIDAIENRVPVFSAEDMARAGVSVEIGADGKLCVEYGYVRHVADETDTSEVAEAAETAPAAAATEDAEDETSAKLPDSLVTDLTIQRTVCLQAALASNPEVAFLATLHAMTLSALYSYGSKSCLQITASTSFPKNSDALKDFAPTKHMVDERKGWTARLPNESAMLWEALKAMPRVEQMQLLAFVAASTVNVVIQKYEHRNSQVAHSHVLAAALDYDIRTDWTPTAENYFSRVTKGRMLADVTEALDERTADLMSHMKKAGMALEAQRFVSGTGWLPAPMRSETAAEEPEDDIDAEGELPEFLQADGVGAESAATA